MRRLISCLFVLATLLLGSCGDDDGSVDESVDTTLDETGDAEPDESADGADDDSSCSAAAEAVAVDQASSSFPDNPDVTWNVVGAGGDSSGLTYIEVVPTPDEVGYPRFRMVSSCDGDDVVLLGAYALDGGTWVLLFTTDAPGASDLEPELG